MKRVVLILFLALIHWQPLFANGYMPSLLNQSGTSSTSSNKTFSHPDRIRYDGSCLTIEGKDVFVVSAAFHYFRCPQELWRDRFRKIKDAGCNTVETYVPWNWHERDMPKSIDDFSQCKFDDLRAWLKMAHEEFGLYTIVRPGPYICAEWAGGGHPRWLAKFCPEKLSTNLWLRSDNPENIRWSQHWYKAICPIIAEEQLTNKPKGSKGIILVQLENEYVYYDLPDEGKIRFLKALYQTAKSCGINVPLFTCVTPNVRGNKDGEISQVFDMDNQYVWWGMQECKTRIEELKKQQPDAPAFVCELQGGWFANVGASLSEDGGLNGRHARGMALMAMAGGATGFNYYMFFGGTQFAGWGARNMTTSYDYGAPIRENGAVGEKYLATKGVCAFVNKYASQLTRTVAIPFTIDTTLKNLVVGLRQSVDGTRFIFLFNSSEKNKIERAVDLHLSNGDKLTFECSLEGYDSRVLVIPAGEKDAHIGEWYPKEQQDVARPSKIPSSIRIASAGKQNENFNVRWTPIKPNVSLPEIGVNDCRYSAYRSTVRLSKNDLAKYGTVVFDMFTADPMYVKVNGKLACRVTTDETNNVFNAAGLLHAGANEIIALYENQGHKHGYKPMEELSGMRCGGLGRKQSSIVPIERWKVVMAKSDSAKDIESAMTQKEGWQELMLDTETISGLSTIQIAGLSKPKWPAAWILQGVRGTAVYKTDLTFTQEMIDMGKTVLEFGAVDEQGILFVNGQEVAKHTLWDMPFIVNIGRFVKPGINHIAIAVTNMYGTGGLLKPIRLRENLTILRSLSWSVSKDIAGISEGLPSGHDNGKWESVSLNTSSEVLRKGNFIQPKGNNDALFTWYKVEFELPEMEKGVWIPWRLLVHASGNGYIWLNGHNIGRHWEIGPQREYFLPECWLKTGKGSKNVIVFGLRQTPDNGALLNAVEVAPYANDCELR